MWDPQQSVDEQSVATFTQEQIEGDEYTRADDEDEGTDSYWNYTDN